MVLRSNISNLSVLYNSLLGIKVEVLLLNQFFMTSLIYPQQNMIHHETLLKRILLLRWWFINSLPCTFDHMFYLCVCLKTALGKDELTAICTPKSEQLSSSYIHNQPCLSDDCFEMKVLKFSNYELVSNAGSCSGVYC